jgi:CheY-like chemotaxis protein
MREIKYDIRRGADTYRAIFGSRLKIWISKGIILRGDAVVWRSGLSGWRKPEELEELAPIFDRYDKQQLKEAKKQKDRILLKRKRVKDILIIDDEQDLCRIMSRILSSKGYNVVSENTSREGLTSLQKEKPDLVFLDLKLPDGDGMELLSQIRELSPMTAVIIISAYGSDENRLEAKEKGVYSFIDKPFVEENILRNIKLISQANE